MQLAPPVAVPPLVFQYIVTLLPADGVSVNDIVGLPEFPSKAPFDVTDEARPMGVSTYDVKETDDDFCKHGGRFGAHASHENTTPIFHKRLMFFSWFNAGMRVVDVRDPYNPKEVGYFIAPVTKLTDKRCADEVKNTDCKIAIQTNNMEVDDRGYIYIVDRVKDMINVSGFKVFPREVEEVLFGHPAVKEVAVLGAPDPVRGESVKAFVVLKEGQSADAEVAYRKG